jgi:hypothetical protein
MQYLHWEIDAEEGAVVRVELDRQANVRLLDDLNYSAYRTGRNHRYYGGHATQSPVTIPVPHAGRWRVVVDLGGYGGHVSASVSVF